MARVHESDKRNGKLSDVSLESHVMLTCLPFVLITKKKIYTIIKNY